MPALIGNNTLQGMLNTAAIVTPLPIAAVTNGSNGDITSTATSTINISASTNQVLEGCSGSSYISNIPTSEYLSREIQKLAPSAVIDLYVLDTSDLKDIDTGNLGEVVYFHAGTNGLEEPVVWQGNSYVPFPIEMEGFDKNSKGTIPRPILRVSNINGAISSLLYAFEDLIGAKVTRKRTFAKFLDTVNFPGNINPFANQEAGFPDEVFYVSRKILENRLVIEMELSPAWDLHGIKLPRRLCTQNICPWKYKSLECGYFQVPEFARENAVFTATPDTGVQFTVTGHPLNVADTVYVDFTGLLAKNTYTVISKTNNTFLLDVPLIPSSFSGTANITNRFNLADIPIYVNLTDGDRCSRRLSSCQIRYGPENVLPYGGFPGVGWVR